MKVDKEKLKMVLTTWEGQLNIILLDNFYDSYTTISPELLLNLVELGCITAVDAIGNNIVLVFPDKTIVITDKDFMKRYGLVEDL